MKNDQPSNQNNLQKVNANNFASTPKTYTNAKTITIPEQGIKAGELKEALKNNQLVLVKGKEQTFQFDEKTITVSKELPSKQQSTANRVEGQTQSQKTTIPVSKQYSAPNISNDLPKPVQKKIETQNIKDYTKLNDDLIKNAQAGQIINRKYEEGQFKYTVPENPELSEKINQLSSVKANEIVSKSNDFVRTSKEMNNDKGLMKGADKTISFKINLAPKMPTKGLSRGK